MSLIYDSNKQQPITMYSSKTINKSYDVTILHSSLLNKSVPSLTNTGAAQHNKHFDGPVVGALLTILFGAP